MADSAEYVRGEPEVEGVRWSEWVNSPEGQECMAVEYGGSADYGRAEHDHGRGPHVHAWADHPHTHLLRAVCLRPECEGCPTHNIHAGPQAEEAP